MYCGIVCYKSLSHSQCSEAFYKECVQDELFSRSTQFSDGANSVQEKTSQILKKARSAEEESEEFVLDSDDEEELSDRLANVDLDDSDQVWKSLTAEERRDFQKKLNSGELYKLVPHEERNEGGVWWGIRLPRKKVTDISSDCISDGPGLHTSIPPLVKVSPILFFYFTIFLTFIIGFVFANFIQTFNFRSTLKSTHETAPL